MIPFSICGAYIKFHNEEKLEVRILELSVDSFLFRLPKDYLKDKKVLSLDIRFFGWESKKYSGLSLEEDSYSLKLQKREQYYDLYEVTVHNRDFKHYAGDLSREYLNYIDYKLTLDDDELSNKMCQYPLYSENDFSFGRREIEKAYFENHMNEEEEKKTSERLNSYEIGILLENSHLIESFLTCSFDDFKYEYFKRSYALNHPISKVKIRRIYIGNPYCLNLWPTKEVLINAIDKAIKNGLAVTLVLPPISQLKVNEICEDIDYIFSKFERNSLELQVNDWGSYYHFGKVLNVTKGILMYKDRKDPRDKYRNVQSVLLSRGEKEIYLPFCQISTATFCCLNALVCNKDRGKNKRVYACEEYCSKYEIVYPSHLCMVGNYNSILAFNSDWEKDILMEAKNPLSDASSDVKDGYPLLERLVINL